MKFGRQARIAICLAFLHAGVVVLGVAGCSPGGVPAGEMSVPVKTKRVAAMLRQGKTPQEIRQALAHE